MSSPRAGGPSRRRSFTAAQKLRHLAEYEAACQEGQGGAYLRREGLYSSLISEWRRLRDAGLLEGKEPGAKVGRPTAEQAELARAAAPGGRDRGEAGHHPDRAGHHGKSARALGADLRERGARAAAQEALMGAYRELTAAGVATRAAAELTGIARATATRQATPADPEPTPRDPVVPANRLSLAERTRVLEILDSQEFVDQPPLQVYATLLERGQYLCSVSTMYRVLAEAGQVRERRRLARHPARAVPELVATGPGQVYCWDITKLPGPTLGVYYDAYVMIDIYSRYIVGAHVHNREHGLLAEELMKEIFGIHGIPTVVHADRGTSMTSKTVATLLADLGVTRSHSRPKVSNDNPYSESLFKTMKYLPTFPERFGSLADARGFMGRFTHAYNHEHHHTGIGLHTAADVHYGHATTVSEQRSAALAAARLAHPQRFSTSADPKILALPENAWINRPDEPADQAVA